jgi:hypothetical protein
MSVFPLSVFALRQPDCPCAALFPEAAREAQEPVGLKCPGSIAEPGLHGVAVNRAASGTPASESGTPA